MMRFDDPKVFDIDIAGLRTAAMTKSYYYASSNSTFAMFDSYTTICPANFELSINTARDKHTTRRCTSRRE